MNAKRFEEDVAHRRALRLTFRFQGTHVELILMEAIAMVVPPSLEITSNPPGSQFWFELHDEKERTLYRRVQRNPIDPAIEVTTGNPERPFAHLDSGRTKGEFTLLVPDLSEAHAVVLWTWSRPPELRRDRPPSPLELTRFPLGRAIDGEVIARDKIPPRTVSDTVAVYDGAAVIRLSASDNLGPVSATFYRLDDGEEQRGLAVTIDRPGEHTLRFWSVDRAGNVEPETRVTFSVGSSAKREGA